MCLISVAPKGTAKYNKQIEGFVEKGMSTNTDGSGFMYKKNGSDVINIDKGYYDAEEMLSVLKGLKLALNDELVIHHRIGTSGEKNVTNMHPFLLSDTDIVLGASKGAFNYPAMAHNGVFNGYSDWQSLYSDTYHFIKEFMSIPEFVTLLKRDSRLFSDSFKSVISYNKLAFLFPDRDLVLIGAFTEDEGYYHSNQGYKDYVYDRGGNSYNKPHKYKKHIPYTPSQLFDDNDPDYDYSEAFLSKRQININQNYGKELLDKKLLIEAVTSKQISVADRLPNIKLLYNDIVLTSDNFHHFMFLPSISYGSSVDKGVLYGLDQYTPGMQTNCIYAIKSPNVLYSINVEPLLAQCTLFVKADYAHLYKGLENLIIATNRKISPTMSKKINTILKRKLKKDSFTFKQYGILDWHVLEHFYSTYKHTEEDDNIKKLDEFIRSKESVLTNAEIVEDISS